MSNYKILTITQINGVTTTETVMINSARVLTAQQSGSSTLFSYFFINDEFLSITTSLSYSLFKSATERYQYGNRIELLIVSSDGSPVNTTKSLAADDVLWAFANASDASQSFIYYREDGVTKKIIAQITLANLEKLGTINIEPVKLPARVASTANVNIASAPASIDGVTLANGNRVLLKNQTTGSQNGIYDFVDVGVPMTRSADFDISSEVMSGLLVVVSEGTVNSDSLWELSTNDPITIGVTALVFTKIGDTTGLVSGTGTTGYIPKWNSASSITNSIIFELTGQIGIGTTTPDTILSVQKNQNDVTFGKITNATADTDAGAGWIAVNDIGSHFAFAVTSSAFTATPDVSLIVSSSANGIAISTDDGTTNAISISATNNVAINDTNSTTAFQIFKTGVGTAVVSVNSTAGVTTFTATAGGYASIVANGGITSLGDAYVGGQLHVLGSAITNSTYSAKFENSAGVNSAYFRNDGYARFGPSNVTSGYQFTIVENTAASIVPLSYYFGLLNNSNGNSIAMSSYDQGTNWPTLAFGNVVGATTGMFLRQSSGDFSFASLAGTEGWNFTTNSSPVSRLYIKGDNTGVGINNSTPTAQLHIKGSGATSATYSLKVQNSASTYLFNVRDDGYVGIGTTSQNAILEVRCSTTSAHVEVFNLYDGTNTQIFRVLDDGIMYFGKTWFSLPPVSINQGFLEVGGASQSGFVAVKNVAGYESYPFFIGKDKTDVTQFSVSTTGVVSSAALTFLNTSINTTAGDSATINASAGRFRKDATGSTFTLTNSYITASSIIILTGCENTTAVVATYGVSCTAGSATITFYQTLLGVLTPFSPGVNQDVNFIIIN